MNKLFYMKCKMCKLQLQYARKSLIKNYLIYKYVPFLWVCVLGHNCMNLHEVYSSVRRLQRLYYAHNILIKMILTMWPI